MLVGFTAQAKPAGETAGANATVPVNPFSGATVIVEVATVLARVEMPVGAAETLKSGDALDW